MRRPRRRTTYYVAISLHDGTVTAAYPERKPAARIMKRDRIRPDEDNVLQEHPRSGMELANATNEGRFRFQDTIANRLNARRAIRELVLPRVDSLDERITSLQQQLDRIEKLLEQKGRATDGIALPLDEPERKATKGAR